MSHRRPPHTPKSEAPMSHSGEHPPAAKHSTMSHETTGPHPMAQHPKHKLRVVFHERAKKHRSAKTKAMVREKVRDQLNWGNAAYRRQRKRQGD